QDAVPSVYDSLLAKVIAWAPSREQAALRLADALDHTYLAGVHTNERWLGRILRSPIFLEGRHSVALLDRRAADFSRPVAATPEVLALAALAARPMARAGRGAVVAASPWEVCDGFHPNFPARIDLTLSSGGRTHQVRLVLQDGQPCKALLAAPAGEPSTGESGARLELAAVAVTDDTIIAAVGGKRRSARWLRRGPQLHVWIGDAHHEFLLEDPRTKEFTAGASSGGLTTPLPGVVAAVAVRKGQTVSAGEVLMVIEAMKMEHSITAPHDGVVREIHFAAGDRVPEGSELLALSRTGDGTS
ncbi:MAG: biotin/lipoyl-containing protein, partial [Steroidobacteraceae bacterium]